MSHVAHMNELCRTQSTRMYRGYLYECMRNASRVHTKGDTHYVLHVRICMKFMYIYTFIHICMYINAECIYMLVCTPTHTHIYAHTHTHTHTCTQT